jgi:4-hydroxybenzoate polyprenyltransferase
VGVRLSLLRIIRPVLAPTAAADVLAGAAFAGGAEPARLAWATAASVLLYAGGMAQNDLCDRERDATLEPDRALVVDPGLVRPARVLVAVLFVLGLVAGALADLLWPALVVAALATAYNLGLKRYFPFDALALGTARSANLALGLLAAAPAFDTALLVYPGAYGLFIAAVTAASRAEDLEPVQTRRLALLLAFVPKVVAFVGLSTVARSGLLVLVFAAPCVLQGTALIVAMRAGTRGAAKRYTFHSLLLIYVIHACTLWAHGNEGGLIAILCCAAVTCFLLAALAWRS